MLEQLLTLLGVPALIVGAATFAWAKLARLERDVDLLWDRTGQHETRLSRVEGRWEAKH